MGQSSKDKEDDWKKQKRHIAEKKTSSRLAKMIWAHPPETMTTVSVSFFDSDSEFYQSNGKP